MVNPGAFRGSRKEFLMKEKAAFSAGVAGGYAAEALALIQRRYFKRYPIDLPHDQEPPDEDIDAVDDDAADPETVEPDPERLTKEEYAAAIAQIEERTKLLRYRKAQIKRWMAYQHMKDNDLNPKDSGTYNPYHAILTKITGKEINRPRCKTGANIWRKSHRDEIEAELKRRLGDLKGKRNRLAAERDKIAREMFSKLEEEEQGHWKSIANAEHEEQMKEYNKDLEFANTPSTAPEDRQRSIQGLVHFAQPILDMICAATGWKVTLIAGGPEPAQDGQLNVISIHSGTTSGDVKMNFGCAEREHYKKFIIPIYGSFLQKCYTPDECRSRALPSEEGFIPISAMDDHTENESVSVFSYTPSVSTPPAVGASVSASSCGGIARVSSTSRAGSAETHSTTINGRAALRANPTVAQIRPSTIDSSAAPEDVDSIPSTVPSHTQLPPSDLTSPQSRVPSLVPSPAASHTRSPSHGLTLPHSRLPSPAPSPAASCTHSTPSDHTFLSSRAPPAHAPTPPPLQSRVPSPAACRSPSPSPALGSRVASGALQPPHTQLPLPSPGSHFVASCSTAGATVQPTSETNAGLSTRSMARIAASKTGVVGAAETGRKGENKRGRLTSTSDTERLTNEEQAPKRQKRDTNVALPDPSTSTALSVPAMTQAPGNAPEWFKTTFSMVHSADLSPEWTELIRKWAVFEVKEGYKEVSKLGTLHRPVSVKEWIQRRRSPTWKPAIPNLLKYGEEVMEWWTSLQPPWRISSEGSIIFTATDGDWELLRRPGVNGLLSVIACLFHWGVALQKNGKEVKHPDWLAVVKDCSAVYTYLLQ